MSKICCLLLVQAKKKEEEMMEEVNELKLKVNRRRMKTLSISFILSSIAFDVMCNAFLFELSVFCYIYHIYMSSLCF